MDVGIIQGVVEGIAHLYKESCRIYVSEADFLTTLVLLGLDKSVSEKMKIVIFFSVFQIDSKMFKNFQDLLGNKR